jgi:hypothetical protein
VICRKSMADLMLENDEAKILLLPVKAIDITENSEIATITRFDPTIDCG